MTLKEKLIVDAEMDMRRVVDFWTYPRGEPVALDSGLDEIVRRAAHYRKHRLPKTEQPFQMYAPAVGLEQLNEAAKYGWEPVQILWSSNVWQFMLSRQVGPKPPEVCYHYEEIDSMIAMNELTKQGWELLHSDKEQDAWFFLMRRTLI